MTLAFGKTLSKRLERDATAIGPSDLGIDCESIGFDDGLSGPFPAVDVLEGRLCDPLGYTSSGVFEPSGRFLGILRVVLLGGA